MESVVTVKYILVFLAVVLALTVVLTIYFRPDDFQKSRLNVFISILASVTVVLIGLSLVMSAMNYEKTVQINRVTMTKNAIDKLWLYPNQLLATSPHISPEFLRSLYVNNPRLFNSCVKGKDVTESCISVIEEQNIAIVMIQAWEDYLTVHSFDKTGDRVWLTNFIQWAQSPYLHEYFEQLKYNFKDTTIELGTLLFEYAQKLPIPTNDPRLYYNTVSELLQDPRLKQLLNPNS